MASRTCFDSRVSSRHAVRFVPSDFHRLELWMTADDLRQLRTLGGGDAAAHVRALIRRSLGRCRKQTLAAFAALEGGI